MTFSKTGGPAFPVKKPKLNDIPGMSLRDYFAAKAMAVLLDSQDKFVGSSAADCYKYADAMLEARKK